MSDRPVLPAVPDVLAGPAGGLPVRLARKASVPLVRAAVRIGGQPGEATALVREGGPTGRALSLAGLTVLDTTADGVPLRQRLRRLAADVDVTSDPDGLVLLVTVAAPDGSDLLEALLPLLAGTAGPPGADAAAAAAARVTALLEVAASQPGGSARRAALARLYGDTHPYAEPLPGGSPVEVDPWWSGARPVAVAVVCPQDPRALLDVLMGAGPPAGPAAPLPGRPGLPGGGRLQPGWVAVERPGSTQSAFRVAAAMPGPGDPGRAAAEVLDQLLGGYHRSRVRLELREKRGWGYHPGSELVTRLGATHLEIEADVAGEVTSGTGALLRDILAGSAVPAPADELQSCREAVLGSLRAELDSQVGTARLLLHQAAFGLPADALGEHVRAVATITAEQVAALAGTALGEDRVVGAVAGEPDEVRAALQESRAGS